MATTKHVVSGFTVQGAVFSPFEFDYGVGFGNPSQDCASTSTNVYFPNLLDQCCTVDELQNKFQVCLPKALYLP